MARGTRRRRNRRKSDAEPGRGAGEGDLECFVLWADQPVFLQIGQPETSDPSSIFIREEGNDIRWKLSHKHVHLII